MPRKIKVEIYSLNCAKMPPRRDFSRKVDYKLRNVHDNLLELLRSSTNEVVKGKGLIPKVPFMKIDDNLYDNRNLLKDAQLSISGMELFRRWFS
jgi:hypothetical protein